MIKPAPSQAESWSSSGLGHREALSEWRDWAVSTIAPIEVEVFDTDAFAARWVLHGIGQLRMLHLHAPAQRVTYVGAEGSAIRAVPTIQLVYSCKGVLKTTMEGKTFDVEPGQFVLLDNTRFYQMEMATEHEAVDLMIPKGWLEKYIPDPSVFLARPISARDGWGAPLGALIETMLSGMDEVPLPRPLLAEQIGSLLALATGSNANEAPRQTQGRQTQGRRGQLASRILRQIESEFDDPDLSPEMAARQLGISKRYLQTLLAGSGTSFVQELNATRLDRASEMLTDPRASSLDIADIAFRAGFLDPGYFTRLFRKRFGITPREWRAGHAPHS